MPPSQTLALFGRMPEPNERRKLFGEPTPSPQYLRWRVFGRMPKPQGVYGERPMPPMSDAAAIRGAEPNEKTQAVWGAYPKPPISPMACIWELPKPQGVYGECPMPPRQDAAAIRGAEPNFSFFNFNSIPHDAKHQLGRHGVLQTTY